MIFGIKIKDSSNLGSYGMQPGATAHMALDDHDWEPFVFGVVVETPTDFHNALLKVTAEDKVEYVKKWIAAQTSIPPAARAALVVRMLPARGWAVPRRL